MAHARGQLIEAAHATVGTPGPLRAFFARVRARRGEQTAIVAVARKLAVIAWHVLRSRQGYRWPRATLIRDKHRRLERTLGISRTRLRSPSAPTIAQRRAEELAVLATAEADYRAVVATRLQRADAPPQWGATVRVRRPRCAAEHKPRTPLFSPRSGRVHPKD